MCNDFNYTTPAHIQDLQSFWITSWYSSDFQGIPSFQQKQKQKQRKNPQQQQNIFSLEQSANDFAQQSLEFYQHQQSVEHQQNSISSAATAPFALFTSSSSTSASKRLDLNSTAHSRNKRNTNSEQIAKNCNTELQIFETNFNRAKTKSKPAPITMESDMVFQYNNQNSIYTLNTCYSASYTNFARLSLLDTAVADSAAIDTHKRKFANGQQHQRELQQQQQHEQPCGTLRLEQEKFCGSNSMHHKLKTFGNIQCSNSSNKEINENPPAAMPQPHPGAQTTTAKSITSAAALQRIFNCNNNGQNSGNPGSLKHLSQLSFVNGSADSCTTNAAATALHTNDSNCPSLVMLEDSHEIMDTPSGAFSVNMLGITNNNNSDSTTHGSYNSNTSNNYNKSIKNNKTKLNNIKSTLIAKKTKFGKLLEEEKCRSQAICLGMADGLAAGAATAIATNNVNLSLHHDDTLHVNGNCCSSTSNNNGSYSCTSLYSASAAPLCSRSSVNNTQTTNSSAGTILPLPLSTSIKILSQQQQQQEDGVKVSSSNNNNSANLNSELVMELLHSPQRQMPTNNNNWSRKNDSENQQQQQHQRENYDHHQQSEAQNQKQQQKQQQEKSSTELYKEAADLLGLSCTLCDNCRCLDCQGGYFDCDDSSDSFSDYSLMEEYDEHDFSTQAYAGGIISYINMPTHQMLQQAAAGGNDNYSYYHGNDEDQQAKAYWHHNDNENAEDEERQHSHEHCCTDINCDIKYNENNDNINNVNGNDNATAQHELEHEQELQHASDIVPQKLNIIVSTQATSIESNCNDHEMMLTSSNKQEQQQGNADNCAEIFNKDMNDRGIDAHEEQQKN